MANILRTNDSHVSPKRNIAFISYSSADRKYLDGLRNQLSYSIRKWNLKVWDNTQTLPGGKWHEELEQALQSTKVAVLLLSPDYFASDAIVTYELPTLLKAAKEEGVILLCVILKFCHFEQSELAEFQSVNPPSRPLDMMNSSQRNKIWNEVAERVRKILSNEQEEGGLPSPQAVGTGSDSVPSVARTVEKGDAPLSQLKGSPASVKQAKENVQPHCDICILCAMEEEVKAFIDQTSRICQGVFQSTIGPHTKRDYRYTTIQNNKGEPLTLYVTWPPNNGPEETSLHFKDTLRELTPRFTAMTGICAGDKTQVALGDIVVAERAFRADTGKIVSGRRSRKEQLYDVHTYQPDSDILQFVRMFDTWKQALKGLKRPLSREQQRDWLLTRLLEEATPRVDDIPGKELKQHAPDWWDIVPALQKGEPRYLTGERALIDKTMIRDFFYARKSFPHRDPREPRRFIAPMASGSAVRADNPFEEIRRPVRGTLAYDMEGATFYRTVAEFHGLRALLVKGISDYADPDKDDSYHQYAAIVSAIYMLTFIQEFVTSERFQK